MQQVNECSHVNLSDRQFQFILVQISINCTFEMRSKSHHRLPSVGFCPWHQTEKEKKKKLWKSLSFSLRRKKATKEKHRPGIFLISKRHISFASNTLKQKSPARCCRWASIEWEREMREKLLSSKWRSSKNVFAVCVCVGSIGGWIPSFAVSYNASPCARTPCRLSSAAFVLQQRGSIKRRWWEKCKTVCYGIAYRRRQPLF